MKHINSKKIAGSSLWLTVSFALTKVSQLVAQILLAHLLSPRDFGIWGMVLIVTTLSALFKDTAIAGVLVYRGLDDKKLVDAVYSLGVNISIIMFAIQALIGFPLAYLFGEPQVFPLTIISGLVFLLGAGAGSHGAVLQRQMKFRELAITDSGAGFARFAGAIVCAELGGGVWSFAVAEIAMTVVDAFLKRCFSRYRFTYRLIPDASAVREVQGYISSLIGINLAVYVNTNGDNFIIGKLLGAEKLGYYNLAYQLAMLPTFAISQINRISFSVLSQRDNEGQRIYLRRMLELYALLYAPLYGVAFVVASWIIPLVYGAEWTPAVSLFQIVLVFAYARGFMSILGTALNAVSKPDINAVINWVLVPVSIPAYLIGTWLGGATGVAIAVALVMGIAATVWFWLAMCTVAKWNITELSKPVLLPTATICLAVTTVSSVPLLIGLAPILRAVLVVLMYGISLSVFSAGKIPRMLMSLIKHSFNVGNSSTHDS
ncbi:oligosaccharide flippase family protein [Aetokthonos hydrillicola Thurmond2011]|uniref:Oligosaccharide flippase family protein n=1 Tax=Aetokthonos hydrillicola Thurmond2011 TaxID=2712845 RepID=A0AAP5I353_9CYAN|nr:oligosaccharide flippase family protein [Aetokthonos hydrillicola]MBO3458291.1 oligosaccharide flippase family protein [Aetokthonos hydrillicola CCALA 1050]MBW4585853.1 oligosaccharide flippase family protein [Aetokthonos hydrillicola CCALA 1050]MDR9893921.1 oligosaccharide flippase family protein [Aetokthonos hydrillicola Thurmond2011]